MALEIIYDSLRQDFEAKILASGFKCKRCGECCRGLGETAIQALDVARWINQNRLDIIERVFVVLMRDGKHEFDWCHPGTKEGRWSGGCPFLRKVNGKNIYKCRIQETKPIACVQHTCEKE